MSLKKSKVHILLWVVVEQASPTSIRQWLLSLLLSRYATVIHLVYLAIQNVLIAIIIIILYRNSMCSVPSVEIKNLESLNSIQDRYLVKVNQIVVKGYG